MDDPREQSMNLIHRKSQAIIDWYGKISILWSCIDFHNINKSHL